MQGRGLQIARGVLEEYVEGDLKTRTRQMYLFQRPASPKEYGAFVLAVQQLPKAIDLQR